MRVQIEKGEGFGREEMKGFSSRSKKGSNCKIQCFRKKIYLERNVVEGREQITFGKKKNTMEETKMQENSLLHKIMTLNNIF